MSLTDIPGIIESILRHLKLRNVEPKGLSQNNTPTLE
jgi:hypothetical protein